MRTLQRIGLTGLLAGTTTLAAVAGTIVDDTFSQENFGDKLTQLTYWSQQGAATNGNIIEYPAGSGTKVLYIGKGSGLVKNYLDNAKAMGGKLSYKIAFTDPVPQADWFAFFWFDNTSIKSVNNYRVQWLGNSGTIKVRKYSYEFAGYDPPANFRDGNMHTVELLVKFDASPDPLVGTNVLQLFVDGVKLGSDMRDIGGVTTNNAPFPNGYLRRVLPTVDSSTQAYNFNDEATASNYLHRVTITSLARPGSTLVVQ